MLNFNTMDSVNSYSHAMPVNSGNFVHSVAQMSTPITSQSPSLITYLDSANRIHPQSASHWSGQVNRSHSIPNQTISDNNNLPHQNDAGRLDMSKNYPQTIIDGDESGNRANAMETFLEHKGSENVKRFSVNNLLQLANNCRAISNEHRNTSGECVFVILLFSFRINDVIIIFGIITY